MIASTLGEPRKRPSSSCHLRISISFLAGLIGTSFGQSLYPPSVPVEQTRFPVFADSFTADELANFRLHLAYDTPVATTLQLGEASSIELAPGSHLLELTYEHLEGKPAFVDAKLSGAELLTGHEVPESATGSTFESANKALRCDGDYTVSATFRTTGNGTLFSKCNAEGEWTPRAKALFLRGGRLVYDIGWVGAMSGGPKLNDGEFHHAVLIVEDGNVEMFVDGKSVARKKSFRADDVDGQVFKIGKAASDFGGDFSGGTIENVRYWNRSLEGSERAALVGGKLEEVNTPDLNWTASAPVDTFSGLGYPGIPIQLQIQAEASNFQLKEAWVQPLEVADHAKLISTWDEETLAEGNTIYQTLCVTCHGTKEQEGSLPTAMKFHEGEFKNGADPYRLYQTLSKGFGMMVPQPQYTPAQKYAVIQYIREEFLKTANASQLTEVSDTYLASLPRKLDTVEESVIGLSATGDKPYERMNYGPYLKWTYQVNPGEPLDKANIAYKGIAIRLDEGPGGVSKGEAWMIYDHDTMRVAAAYSGGKFVDWKGIAFDGSHGTHTSIGSQPDVITPVGPGWADPKTGSWKDPRLRGRDSKPYGPLPRQWAQYTGLYLNEDRVLVTYNIGDVYFKEDPGWIQYGSTPVFTRNIQYGANEKPLTLRLAEADSPINVATKGVEGVELIRDENGVLLRIPPGGGRLLVLLSEVDQVSLDAIAAAQEVEDLTPYTTGCTKRTWDQTITTRIEPGEDDGPFAVDRLTLPNLEGNPWNSWMRIGGFDFFPDGKRAALCTWMGDVWIVEGIDQAEGELRWTRHATGLFQPLGLKIVRDTIYVACRDQIVRLWDIDAIGNGEADWIECFNNDHQVTEHFHEFAMGLQTDKRGNFYYAKSARHAKVAVVPHHGTLLRVSPDGKTTDIVASGFRAANGVCLNPDGTWIVTDQEGHWNPKNRINYVREGGFYGNMYGYHDVTDESDSAMEQPLCWITNAFDRSPAELLWVPKDAGWGNLDGVLLNLSYGYGQVYTVPHEVLPSGQAQGGMCAFPIENLPTGLHRGRFHPENRQLYAAGMFAWAGSQREDGGFFRIRATGKPAYLPTKLEAADQQYTITFSDPVPQGGEFEVKAWDLKRTASYGSKHYNERSLKVTDVVTSGNQVVLTIPELQPTWGMEISCKLSNGEQRTIHSSIHQLPQN